MEANDKKFDQDLGSRLLAALKAIRATQKQEATPPVVPQGLEKPLTRSEVQGVLNGMSASVKNIMSHFERKIIESANILRDRVKQEIDNRKFATIDEARQMAKDAVPVSLRGLDSDSQRKRGDILRLLSGGAVGNDMAIWGKADAVQNPVVAPKAFGIKSITGPQVVLHGGSVIHGTRIPVVLGEQTLDISVPNVPVYAFLQYAFSGLATVSVSNAYPYNSSGVVVRCLHQFTRTNNADGSVTVVADMTFHEGSVVIDGCYA